MAIRWDFKEDHMGKVVVEQEIKDGELERFTLDIYRGNCLAIFVYNYKDEKTGDAMYQLHNFFMDKEHAKRMLGLDRRYKETYGHNQMELDSWRRYTEFHLDGSCKDAKELAKLLMDASWKQPITIKMYPNMEAIKQEVKEND